MATISGHETDCLFFLRKKYTKVHEFLDSCAEDFSIHLFDDYHRTFLHNIYGLFMVEAFWGKEARTAAVIHLTRDYYQSPIRKMKLETILEQEGKILLYFNDPSSCSFYQ